ncbi:DUF2207 domain-containing protein [Actinomadura viridis]|uniref:DUF2207 domain-containing protein n=1 Tax=Actinomadura viridis TaxID=58110 RepID=UPI0036888BB5
MRWLLRVCVLCTVFGIWVLGATSVRADAAERVTRFESTVRVGADGVVRVREAITYDFGDGGAHGLRRDVPWTRTGLVRNREYAIENVRASTPERAPLPVRTDRGARSIEIRAGDPARTVTGVRTYVLEYDLRAVLTPGTGHDELRWDFVGNGWDVPVGDVTVRVTAPGIGGVTCEGGKARCVRSGDTVTIRQDRVGQGMESPELKLRLSKGAVTVPPPRYGPYPWEAAPYVAVVAGVAALLAAGVLVLALARTAADRRRLVRLRNAPPARTPPGLAGLLWKGGTDYRHTAATLLDLADRGLLRIEQGEEGTRERRSRRTWTLTTAGEPGDDLLPYERALLDDLNRRYGGGPVTLDVLRRDFTLAALGDMVDDEAFTLGLVRRWRRRGERALRVLVATSAVASFGAGVAAGLRSQFTAAHMVGLMGYGAGGLCALALLPDRVYRPRRTWAGQRRRRRLAGYRRRLRKDERAGRGPTDVPLPYRLVLVGRRDEPVSGRPVRGLSGTAGAMAFVHDLVEGPRTGSRYVPRPGGDGGGSSSSASDGHPGHGTSSSTDYSSGYSGGYSGGSGGSSGGGGGGDSGGGGGGSW